MYDRDGDTKDQAVRSPDGETDDLEVQVQHCINYDIYRVVIKRTSGNEGVSRNLKREGRT